MSLYKNKYRVESTRLKNWDYSRDGYYFITICTKDQKCAFGDINKGKMLLNDLGNAAHRCWMEIPAHFPFVRLDEFCIMPNHVHGIAGIDRGDDNNVANIGPNVPMETNDVETQNFASLRSQHTLVQPHDAVVRSRHALAQSTDTENKSHAGTFGPQSKNIASIIRGFKIGVTKYANIHAIPFQWQPRFYDHVVRDEQSLTRIREYIINNPLKWESAQILLEHGTQP